LAGGAIALSPDLFPQRHIDPIGMRSDIVAWLPGALGVVTAWRGGSSEAVASWGPAQAGRLKFGESLVIRPFS
jgi:hypothetical protein